MLGHNCIEKVRPGNNLPHFWCCKQDFKINKCKGKVKVKFIHLYSTLFCWFLIKSAWHATPSSCTINCVIPLWGGATSFHLNSLGSIQAMRLPLGTVNLFGMHIIPPLTITAGTHFIYPQRDGGLSQHPARLSQEWVLNLGPHMGRSAALPTELSQPKCTFLRNGRSNT